MFHPKFHTALKAEFLKRKRTGVFLVSLVIGLVIPLIDLCFVIFSDSSLIKQEQVNVYSAYLDDKRYDIFLMLILPIVIVTSVSMLTQLDHRNNGWRLMETLPLRKWHLYFSKLAMTFAASIIAIFTFFLASCLLIYFGSTQLHLPERYDLYLPLADLLYQMFRTFIASMFATALLYALAVKLRGFIWPIAISMCLIILSPFTLNPSHAKWRTFLNPFVTILQTRLDSQIGSVLLFSEWLSVVACLLCCYLGYQWYAHPTFLHAFASTSKKTLQSILIVGILGYALYTLNAPKTIYPFTQTVISGKLENQPDIHSLTLFDIWDDSIATFPVINGTFHHRLDTSLPLQQYRLSDSRYFSLPFFFSAGDSIYFKMSFDDLSLLKKAEILGTRLAENSGQAQEINVIDQEVYFMLSNDLNLQYPFWYADALEKSWNNYFDNQVPWTSNDNYITREDFRERQNQLNSVRIIQIWNTVIQKRTKLYPEEPQVIIPFIDDLQNHLGIFDPSLLTGNGYKGYIIEKLTANDSSDETVSNKMLRALSTENLNDPVVQKLFYHELNKSLKETAAPKERAQLMEEHFLKLSTPYYQQKIAKHYQDLIRLQPGNAAPLIDMENAKGEKVQWSDFAGKYVVVDVWATWCAPCHVQTPYFEKVAKRMQGENIVFLGISVDKNRTSWLISDNISKETVVPLRALDYDDFTQKYLIKGVPTFLMIGPDGDIRNLNLPFPQDNNFEDMIRKEMSAPPGAAL